MSLAGMKLLIATPFYETKGFSPYISSLVGTTCALMERKVSFGYLAMSGDAYVARVRNTIANNFLDETDCTHLLFIDSDLAWEPYDLVRLLEWPNVDIVGAAYPIKNNQGKYTCVPMTDEDCVMTRRDDGLLLGAALSMGFTLITREALLKIAEAFPDHWYIDNTAELNVAEPKNDKKWRDFFGHIQVNKTMLGEDYSFSFRAFKANVPIWIQADTRLLHFGISNWPGSYEDFLMKHAPNGKLPEELATWRIASEPRDTPAEHKQINLDVESAALGASTC